MGRELAVKTQALTVQCPSCNVSFVGLYLSTWPRVNIRTKATQFGLASGTLSLKEDQDESMSERCIEERVDFPRDVFPPPTSLQYCQCPSSLDSCNDSHPSRSFFVRDCILLVLRPDRLFPENPLLNHCNALRTLDTRITCSEIFVGFLLFPAEILLHGLTQSFSAFDFGYLRRPEDSLSAFFLLFHGNLKLQNAEEGSNNSLLAICALFFETTVHAIFMSPGRFRIQFRLRSYLDPRPHQHTVRPNLIHQASRRGTFSDLRGERSMGLYRRDCGIAEDHPNLGWYFPLLSNGEHQASSLIKYCV